MKKSYFLLSLGGVLAHFLPLKALDTAEQMQAHMKQISNETVMNTYGASLAPGLNLDKDVGIELSLDVLYWQPKVNGTAFAYSASGSDAAIPLSGTITEVDFDWNFGFKAGIGYHFNHDKYDVFAEYTYYHLGTSNSLHASAGNTVVPLKGYPDIPGGGLAIYYCTTADSEFTFSFQTLNLLLRKQYFITRFTSFNPYVGLKAAKIDLDQITHYSGGTTDPLNALAYGLGNNMVLIKDNNDFGGIGLVGGISPKFYMSKHFNVEADLSFALLYGYFKIKHFEQLSNTDRFIRLNGDIHRLVAMGQMKLGLAYDTYFGSNNQFLSFFLGYEGQYWLRQNNMIYVTTPQKMATDSSQDLSLSGVSFEIRYIF